jgi:glycosyltransferase involved in cell wall biosynthesis
MRVSVVIPTYNRREKLKRAIDSVLAQTFEDFEVIIVDNASTDDTYEMIQSIKDPRVECIRHEKNLGGPAARNTGIRHSRAAYIALLDDDDQWSPQKLEKQMEVFQKASAHVGLVYVGSEIYDENTARVLNTNLPQFKGNVYERLLLSTIIGSVTSVLIRRECFEDWDMWLRISQKYEFDYVPDILARINMHGEQISTNYAALIPGRTRMVEKHWEIFAAHPNIFVVHLKRLGKLHCLNGTYDQAWGWFKKAIEVQGEEIFKIIAWILLEYPLVVLFSKSRHFKKFRGQP